MNEVEILKKQVKKYIETADAKVVKMVHAMLAADAEDDWWDDLSEPVKEEISKALKGLDKGAGMTHAEVKKNHPEWFPK